MKKIRLNMALVVNAVYKLAEDREQREKDVWITFEEIYQEIERYFVEKKNWVVKNGYMSKEDAKKKCKLSKDTVARVLEKWLYLPEDMKKYFGEIEAKNRKGRNLWEMGENSYKVFLRSSIWLKKKPESISVKIQKDYENLSLPKMQEKEKKAQAKEDGSVYMVCLLYFLRYLDTSVSIKEITGFLNDRYDILNRQATYISRDTIARNVLELLQPENKFFLDYIGLRIAMGKPDKQHKKEEQKEELFMLDGQAVWKEILDGEHTKGLWDSKEGDTEFSKLRTFYLEAAEKGDAWKKEWIYSYFGSEAAKYLRFMLHYGEYVDFESKEIYQGEEIYNGEVMAYALTLNEYLVKRRQAGYHFSTDEIMEELKKCIPVAYVERKNYRELIQRALTLSVEAGEMKNITEDMWELV